MTYVVLEKGVRARLDDGDLGKEASAGGAFYFIHCPVLSLLGIMSGTGVHGECLLKG